MQARYIREMNRHYLAISISDEIAYGYQIPMLLNNRIKGILPVHIQNNDGQIELYYEVTSWQSLKEYYEAKKMNLTDIQNLLWNLSYIAEELEQYLLKGTCIALEPEYIYINTEKGEICFCYDPSRKETVQNCLNQFACFVMDHIDYEDKASVKLAYTLFQESMWENASVSNFARLAGKYDNIEEWEQEEKVRGEIAYHEEISSEMQEDNLNEAAEVKKEKKSEKGKKVFIWQLFVSIGIFFLLAVVFLWFLIELQKRLLLRGKQIAAIGIAGILAIIIVIIGIEWLTNRDIIRKI